MIRILYFVVIAISMEGALALSLALGDGFPELSGPLFSQNPPGGTAEVFAPELISVTGRYEFGLSFSPSGDILL